MKIVKACGTLVSVIFSTAVFSTEYVALVSVGGLLRAVITELGETELSGFLSISH